MTTKKSEDKKVEEAEKQVQEIVDQETEKGFRGIEIDETPNENYTVQGQGAGKDVPEAAADPVAARAEASNS